MDFETIVLVDYSLTNLKNARSRIKKFLKNNPGKVSSIYFIAADAASLPFKSSCADMILTVRVVHHLESPEKYFDEVSRILKNKGLYFLEFANKRNFKNILRFFIGRMDTSPFNLKPSQVGETILNFHPKYITSLLEKRGFLIKRLISVSNFRLNLLKKFPGTKTLYFLELVYQRFFSFVSLGPSIFLKCILNKSDSKNINERKAANLEEILICASCKKEALYFKKNEIKCKSCGSTFTREDGIYNFKLNN